MADTKITISDSITLPLHFDMSQLAPIQFRQEAWNYFQDQAYKYKEGFDGRSSKDIVNKIMYELHKLPGDYVIRLLDDALGLDLENPEVLQELYKAALKMRW